MILTSRIIRIMAIAGIAAALLIVVALVVMWQGARHDLATAKTGAALAGSRAASGAEATETIAAGAERDAGTDRITQENSHAIDQARGADQRVDDELSRAGALSLCRRAAYRGSAQCVQLLGPGVAPEASPRR